jgi:hypothetical protein
MKKLLLAVAFTAMLASFAEAQQVPDPRVADLVQLAKFESGCTLLCTQRIPERVN